jgi:predicted site-specific integrase-resolvase
MSALPPDQGHLKPRYKFHKVCKIFGIHEDTLRSWMRDGVPLPGGRRTKIHFISRGLRGKEFECDEVERVYQEIRRAA